MRIAARRLAWSQLGQRDAGVDLRAAVLQQAVDRVALQIAPLREKVDAILGDVKAVTARVNSEAEMVDHAIHGCSAARSALIASNSAGPSPGANTRTTRSSTSIGCGRGSGATHGQGSVSFSSHASLI